MSAIVRNHPSTQLPGGTTDANANLTTSGLSTEEGAITKKLDAQALLDGTATQSVGAGGAPVINTYTSTNPELPNVAGPKASVGEAAAVAGNTKMFDPAGGVSGPRVTAAEMYSILQETGNQNYALNFKLNLSANNSVIAAKLQEVADTQKQIEGEQKSAWTKLGVSLGAAAVTVAVPIGAGYASKADRAAMTGKQLDPVAPSGSPSGAAGAGPGPGAGLASGKGNGLAGSGTSGATAPPSSQQAATSTQNNINASLSKPSGAQGAAAAPTTPPPKDKFWKKNGSASGSSNSGTPPTSPDPVPTHAAPSTNSPGTTPNHQMPPGSVTTVPTSAIAERGVFNNGAMAEILGQQGTGAALSDVVTKIGDVGDKIGGGQHDADMAKVAIKVDAVKSQIAQTAADATKAGLDKSLSDIKDAQSAIQRFSDNKMQVDNNTAAR